MYRFDNLDFAGGAGAVRTDGPMLRAPVRPLPATPAPVKRKPRFSLVVDLGDQIGSPTWFRGLLTLGALCATALNLAPPFDPLIGRGPDRITEAEQAEMAALSIDSVEMGSSTGRRAPPTEDVTPLSERPDRPRVDLSATVRGNGIVTSMIAAGVDTAEAQDVARVIGTVVPVHQIQPGTDVEIVLGARARQDLPRPIETVSFRARFDLNLTVQRQNGQLIAVPSPIRVDYTPLRVNGLIGDNLQRTLSNAGVPARAIDDYIRAISTQVNLSTLTTQDRYEVVLEHKKAETGEAEVGRLLYAGYTPYSGGTRHFMRWTSGGRTEWYDWYGMGTPRGTFQRPVPGRVTSDYGYRRHPILQYTRFHRGMDFRAGYGTPILAASDGQVIAAGWAGGYGRQVKITHANGLMTSYSHMSTIAATPGTHVRAGQVIGYVGSTGLSTGPHLHYEIHQNGTPIDPNAVRFISRPQLWDEELISFQTQLRSLLNVPVGTAIASRQAWQATTG